MIDLETDKLLHRISGLGDTLNLSEKAKDYIAAKGFDKKYGARPLKRALQKYIEDALAEEIVNSKLTEGDTIATDLDATENKLTIKIKKGEKKKETRREKRLNFYFIKCSKSQRKGRCTPTALNVKLRVF
jgi:ATP-dependent Clp protease ATP-binding subunit ClpC